MNDIRTPNSIQLGKELNENLAFGAIVYATSEKASAPVSAVLNNDSSFYSPDDGDLRPELMIKLDTEHELDTLLIREAINEQRITGIEAYALVSNDWKLLFKRECVGNFLIEHFESIKTSVIKIKITSSTATPMLCTFGAYKYNK